jgi:peptidoglycan/xylan/chitin deacetylase (PgdA/CDA1 family)
MRRVLPSRQVAILRYHAICGAEGYSYADPSICVTPEHFERHVQYLTSAYRVLRLEDVVRGLVEQTPLPTNAVAVTFDDGYADNLAAARVLHRYGATATFYLTAGCLAGGQPFWPVEIRSLVPALPRSRHTLVAGPVRLELDLASDQGRAMAVKQLTKAFKGHPIAIREQLRDQLRVLAGAVDAPRVMLTWDEVREMHAMGMTIGSHTMTHPNLPNAGLEAARAELVQSKARLEQEIGAPVTMFSYPNGGAERYSTPELQRVVAEVGFAAATTSHNAFAGQQSDIFALERVQVAERLEDLVFALEVERFAFRPKPRH